MNSPKKVLFAISDTGGGHRSGASAIIAALNLNREVQCSIVDILRATALPVIKKAPEIYDYCSKKHLWLNNLFFRKTNSISRINALTKIVYLQSRRRIEKELAAVQPDVVVAVHPLVIGLLRKARDMSGASWPIITVVTDLVSLHASWATPGADLYLVPTQEAYQFLLKNGIPSSYILYTGFPIHPKFIQGVPSQDEARRRLGICQDRYTVLITGGGVGAGNMEDWVTELEENCADKQLLVVTGNNKDLYNQLMNRNNLSEHMQVYGFVHNMEVLMSASDLVISKAGPGTIMEGVSLQRPLIITEAVGIQETGNIDYIVQNHLGYYCPVPAEACQIINRIAATPRLAGNTPNDSPVITDGSMQIASVIQRHLEAAATHNWHVGA